MTDKLPCGCSEWEHYLCDGCPPPRPPRECCGTLDYDSDIGRSCRNGRCVEWYCKCGIHNGSGMGRVGCGCDHWRRGHGTPGERSMLPSPGGRAYRRRQKARAKR